MFVIINAKMIMCTIAQICQAFKIDFSVTVLIQWSIFSARFLFDHLWEDPFPSLPPEM